MAFRLIDKQGVRIAEWFRLSLQAWREGQCDGVVIYCFDKRPDSRSFRLAKTLFRKFRKDTLWADSRDSTTNRDKVSYSHEYSPTARAGLPHRVKLCASESS